VFTGTAGHTYRFYSIASDNVGNTEPAKTVPEAVTMVSGGNTAAPVITLHPTNQTVIDGTNVTFMAAASGTPTPTVEWQVSTDMGATFTTVAAATSTTLTFSTTLAQNGYQYRAVFTNGAGSATTAAAILTVNANQSTTIAGNITAKSGPANARVWTLSLLNNGPGAAQGAAITSFTLTQTAGSACTPTIGTAFPKTIGDMGPGQTGTANVTIDFTGCAAAVRFTATFSFTANGGAVSGSVVRMNQFP
jgi:hypothetical protein